MLQMQAINNNQNTDLLSLLFDFRKRLNHHPGDKSGGDKWEVNVNHLLTAEFKEKAANYMDKLYESICFTSESIAGEILTEHRLNRIDNELEEQLDLLASAKRNRRSIADIEEKLTQGQKEISLKIEELEKEKLKKGQSMKQQEIIN
ncbi:hypothetical protein GJ496_003917, partial [Pomphorhynchus laevis]